MVRVKIYSADYCPFCLRAKSLLDSKNIEYEEVRVDLHPEEKQKVIEQTGMRTIPQIFINGEFIGGCSELMELEHSGELDKKLS